MRPNRITAIVLATSSPTLARSVPAKSSMPSAPFRCPKPNGNFCVGPSLRMPLLVECINNIAKSVDCNERTWILPPQDAILSPCWESGPAAGDAACSKNCVVYPADGNSFKIEENCTETVTSGLTVQGRSDQPIPPVHSNSSSTTLQSSRTMTPSVAPSLLNQPPSMLRNSSSTTAESSHSTWPSISTSNVTSARPSVAPTSTHDPVAAAIASAISLTPPMGYTPTSSSNMNASQSSLSSSEQSHISLLPPSSLTILTSARDEPTPTPATYHGTSLDPYLTIPVTDTRSTPTYSDPNPGPTSYPAPPAYMHPEPFNSNTAPADNEMPTASLAPYITTASSVSTPAPTYVATITLTSGTLTRVQTVFSDCGSGTMLFGNQTMTIVPTPTTPLTRTPWASLMAPSPAMTTPPQSPSPPSVHLAAQTATVTSDCGNGTMVVGESSETISVVAVTDLPPSVSPTMHGSHHDSTMPCSDTPPSSTFTPPYHSSSSLASTSAAQSTSSTGFVQGPGSSGSSAAAGGDEDGEGGGASSAASHVVERSSREVIAVLLVSLLTAATFAA